MNSSKILIVEDENKIATLLSDYLKQSGFETLIVSNGLDVIAKIKRESPSLVLLDLMLPGRDGISICKEVRTFSNLPIIMLTARIEEIDRLLGLELGADDYICKPFSPREVIARIKAVLRRVNNDLPENNEVIMNEDTFETTIKGQNIKLTAIEFRLLHQLVKQPGRIFSRDQLIDELYEDRRIVSGRTIDSHIKKLRKKIALQVEQEAIHSVYSVGYKFQLDE